MATRLNKSLSLIAALLLALVFITALRFGVAELCGMSASDEMARWVQAKRVPTADEIQAVITELKWAVRLAEVNPAHHEAIVQLELTRAAQAGLSPQSRLNLLESARVNAHRAIALRPVSPYSWTLLLVVKRELHEYDEEFRQALHQAVMLGPWEPELLPALVDVGLSAWAALPEKERAIVGETFVRGMQRQQAVMMGIANAHRGDCANQQEACK